MDKAGYGDDVMGKYMSSDSMYTYPVRFNDYWGRWTNLGVHGDARTATAEKGKVILDAAADGLVGLVEEWQQWPIAERSDQHTGPVQKHIRW
jgi:creatinine amidohydrolase/Fe(II)-dependent formamide hydrolase-like protein